MRYLAGDFMLADMVGRALVGVDRSVRAIGHCAAFVLRFSDGGTAEVQMSGAGLRHGPCPVPAWNRADGFGIVQEYAIAYDVSFAHCAVIFRGCRRPLVLRCWHDVPAEVRIAVSADRP